MNYEDINAIPQANEHVLTFRIGKTQFIDSYLFLGSSWEKLTDSLNSSDGDVFQNFHDMKNML